MKTLQITYIHEIKNKIEKVLSTTTNSPQLHYDMNLRGKKSEDKAENVE
jgi:hypothetical protein